uniref:INSulin related n=1 Tax=Caenorhabditis tropicalis TaxID=1561998 RepID=A0A1I7TN48_9PELO
MNFVAIMLVVLFVFASECDASRKHCGRMVYNKIFDICSSGCTIEDATLPTKLCMFAHTDSEIKDMCCPE